MEHVFHGEMNSHQQIVGYHHVSMMSEGEILDRSAPNRYGVYMANVIMNGVAKNARTSFFPDDWDRVKVLDAIREAYHTKFRIRDNKNKGITSAGLKIEMYLDNQDKLLTAYPIY